MRTRFKDYLKMLREDSRARLDEMPMRNNVRPEWSTKVINDLWELASKDVVKVGDIGSEEVFTVTLGSSIFYYFLIKDGKPVFAATFERRYDINGLQEDNIAKGSSVNSAEVLYKFICNQKQKHIISSVSHSAGMEKVWKGFMKKYPHEVYDDDTAKLVSKDDVYPSNKVVRIFFK